MARKILLFLNVWLFVAGGVLAQADLKRLDAYYAKALKDWDVPGIQFDLDNNARVNGIRFDMPNDDLWSEELNAKESANL